nr:YjbH domain-containing protein [Rhizobium sp. 007]
MHLTNTKIAHENGGWRVDFVGDDGDSVTVHVADAGNSDEEAAVERARAIMVKLTASVREAVVEREHLRCRQQWEFRRRSAPA